MFLTAFSHQFYMSLVTRKSDFCLCENKSADQLCSNCTADQRLCFRYTDCTIPLLVIAKISSVWPFSDTVQAGLCQTWSETQKPCFHTSQLISSYIFMSKFQIFMNHHKMRMLPFVFVQCTLNSNVPFPPL